MREVPTRAEPIHRRAGLTLIEILVVVAILALLAVLVIPQLGTVRSDSAEASVRRQLQVLRHQIEFYRAAHAGTEPDLTSDWDPLLTEDLIAAPPINLFNGSTVVSTAAAPGVGWVWRTTANGDTDLFATDGAWGEWVDN